MESDTHFLDVLIRQRGEALTNLFVYVGIPVMHLTSLIY